MCLVWGIPYLLIKVAVLDEPLTLGTAVGFALILAGSVLATRPGRAVPGTLAGAPAAGGGAPEPAPPESLTSPCSDR